MTNHFSPTPQHLFFSKNDPKDQRLGDLSRPCSDWHQDGQVFLVGYPDDEGIAHNGGRPGAAQGPNAIRSRLYRMTPPAFTHYETQGIQDLGNLKVSEHSLFERHHLGSKAAKQVLSQPSNRWIGLGGGHDYGFADGDGFLATFAGNGKQRPLVINFDAHLDVRPMISKEKISSGTPFSRLLEKYPNQFDFLEVGLQPFCNSEHHYKWLVENGGKAIPISDLRKNTEAPTQLIINALKSFGSSELKGRPCFLSVDIDVFSTSHAPGCSQSWPSGMTPREFFPCFEELCNIFSVKTLGIYEVSPPLDQDEQTAKLAAEIIYRFIFG